MNRRLVGLAFALAATRVRSVGAQASVLPPIHPLGSIVARLTIPMSTISQCRVLSTGAVLIDDPSDKQLLLIDPTLTHATHVIDTLGADDWDVLRDGTIAIVRAHDYHIDWIHPDGTLEASPKVPHEWVRMTDSAKTTFLDSIRQFYATPANQLDQTSRRNGVMRARTYAPNLPSADELPDYPPPFELVEGNDADGNLWIREFAAGGVGPEAGPGATAAVGGAVFDLVDRSGRLVDRVQIPGGTSLRGWGPGVVYLASRDGATTSLVRAKIR